MGLFANFLSLSNKCRVLVVERRGDRNGTVLVLFWRIGKTWFRARTRTYGRGRSEKEYFTRLRTSELAHNMQMIFLHQTHSDRQALKTAFLKFLFKIFANLSIVNFKRCILNWQGQQCPARRTTLSWPATETDEIWHQTSWSQSENEKSNCSWSEISIESLYTKHNQN